MMGYGHTLHRKHKSQAHAGPLTVTVFNIRVLKIISECWGQLIKTFLYIIQNKTIYMYQSGTI